MSYSSSLVLVWKSVQINYMFYTSIVVTVIALSLFYPSDKSKGPFFNIVLGFISIAYSLIMGYYVHVISHKYNFQQPLENFAQRKGMPTLIKKIIQGGSYLFHFHDHIHHNSSINREWYNIAIEFMQNLQGEGMALIFLLKMLNVNLYINQAICFAWAWLYATVHNINYAISPSITHVQHHLNKHTNYGFDLADILFRTKYDMNPERINHASINMFLIMIFMLFIHQDDEDDHTKHWFIKSIHWFISSSSSS